MNRAYRHSYNDRRSTFEPHTHIYFDKNPFSTNVIVWPCSTASDRVLRNSFPLYRNSLGPSCVSAFGGDYIADRGNIQHAVKTPTERRIINTTHLHVHDAMDSIPRRCSAVDRLFRPRRPIHRSPIGANTTWFCSPAVHVFQAKKARVKKNYRHCMFALKRTRAARR